MPTVRSAGPASTEDAIIAACAAANTLWEDPHFSPPADETWRRPSEIYGTDATLFAADSVPPTNICLTPGTTGDGWLVGALATLATRHQQLSRLFVSVRGRQFGVFTLQVFVGEAWVPLTIDDRLPCDAEGVPLHARSGVPGELWPALVEKAWAKLLGGYAALRLGYLPNALRGLSGGVPLSLPLDASRASALALQDAGDASVALAASPPSVGAVLSWERLRELVASGTPLAVVRLPSGSAAGASEVGDILAGLAYPVVRTREAAGGSRDVLIASPFAMWSEDVPGWPASNAAADDHERGRWVPFDALPRVFDLCHAVAGCADADARGGEAQLHRASELGISGAPPAASATIHLVGTGEWPSAPRASVPRPDLQAPPTPAFVLALRQPVSSAVLLLEQLLPPRGTAPNRSGIAILLVSIDTNAAGQLLSGSGGTPPARLGARMRAHTLPARPNRRVVLDAQSALPAGQYLVVPLRLTTAPAKAAAFRVEVEAYGTPRSGRAPSSAPLMRLTPVPGGLPRGGSDLLDELRPSVGPLLGAMGVGNEGPTNGDIINAMLAEVALRPQQARAARALQRTIRGRNQRKDLDELRALQLAREAEEEEAALAMQAGVRGRLGRKRFGAQLSAKEQAEQAARDAQAATDAQAAALLAAAAASAANGERSGPGYPDGLHERLALLERQLIGEINKQLESGGSLAELTHREKLLDSVRRFLRGHDAGAEEGDGPRVADVMREREEALQRAYEREVNDAAARLQAGYRGRGSRAQVRGMHQERAARVIQAGARGRHDRQTLREARRERELARLRAAGNFELAIEWLDDDRIEQLLAGSAPRAPRADDAGFFGDAGWDGDGTGGALRYVPVHVANAARLTVGTTELKAAQIKAAKAAGEDEPLFVLEAPDEEGAEEDAELAVDGEAAFESPASVAAAAAAAAAEAAAAYAAAAAAAAGTLPAAGAPPIEVRASSPTTPVHDEAEGALLDAPDEDEEESAPAPPLPSLPAPGENAAPSYRSRFTALQREQRQMLEDMRLPRPEKVARLLVERDEALEALALAESSAAALVASDGGGGGGAVLSAGELHGLLAAQMQMVEQQREQYEASMHRLAAELARQHAPPQQLEVLEKLSHSLESALARVQALELGAGPGGASGGGGRGRAGRRDGTAKPSSRACIIS